MIGNLIEGKGIRPPKPILIQFDTSEYKQIVTFAKKVAEMRNWKEENAIRGFLGEAAFGKYLYQKTGIPYATDLKIYNTPTDGGFDHKVGKYKIQTKTSKSQIPSGIVRVYESKDIAPLIADYYVFCFSDLTCKASILGFLRKEELLEAPRGMKYGKYMFLPSADHLRPVDRLIKLLKYSKG